MKRVIFYLILIAFCKVLLPITAWSQVGVENNYALPIDPPLVMSASFCEPRGSHFHSGVDYKTRGVVGQNLYSIADGELYRLRISPYGYGLAMYILNEDSTLSVYAHLLKFRDDVAKLAKEVRYAAQSDVIDTIFDSAPIRFKKGEFIGYSGNSGHSFGAHLHFEIRDFATEDALNAQTYFPVTDRIPPDFVSVVVYDLNQPWKHEKYRAKRYGVYGGWANYRRSSLVVSTGKCALGAEIKDRMNGTNNRYGVVEVQLLVDEELMYHSRIDRLPWSDQELVNVWFDAYYYDVYKRYIQRCYVEESNISKNIVTQLNNGIVDIKAGEEKSITIKAWDSAGNMSQCEFNLIGDTTKLDFVKQDVLSWDKPNFLVGEGYFLDIPAGSMYRDANPEIITEKSGDRITAWRFDDKWFPFIRPFKLALDGSHIPFQYRDKTLVRCEKNGKRALFGTWEGAYFVVKSKIPGRYYFQIDSIPPVLLGYYRDSSNLSYRTQISYKTSDNLSGIKSYDAWIDDQWVLLEYFPSYKKLVYRFDEMIERKSWHTWKIRIEDKLGNIKTDEFVFYY
jgi:hypothetical protein